MFQTINRIIAVSCLIFFANSCTSNLEDPLTQDKPTSMEGTWILDHSSVDDTTIITTPYTFGTPSINHYEDVYDSLFDNFLWTTLIKFHGDSVTYCSRQREYNKNWRFDTLDVQTAPYQIIDGRLRVSILELDSLLIHFDTSAQEIVFTESLHYENSYGETKYQEASVTYSTFHRFEGELPDSSDRINLPPDVAEPFNNDSSTAGSLQLGVWSEPLTIHSFTDSDWFKVPVDKGTEYAVEIFSEAKTIPCTIFGSFGYNSISYTGTVSAHGVNIPTRVTFRPDSSQSCYIRVGSFESEGFEGTVRGAYKIRLSKVEPLYRSINVTNDQLKLFHSIERFITGTK